MATAPMSEPVVSGWRLSDAQRVRLGQASKLAAGTPAERREAAAIVRGVEAEIAASRDQVETERCVARALERARRAGEAVEIEEVVVGEWRRDEDGALVRRRGELVLDTQTVRRASRVDGLASLYKSGALTDDEKRTGDELRSMFEKAMPPMSVSAYGSTQAGFKDVGHMLVSVAEAGEALADLDRLRRAVGDARTWAVVEAVAGRGATIRSLGAGGDLNMANRQRLKTGLATLKEALKDLKRDRLTKSLASKER